jgi:Cu2+-exporting ATPase
MTVAAIPVPTRAVADVVCAHCALPVPAGFVELAAEQQFCCAGCRTAFAILHEHGLDRYYDLPERRDRPVLASGRSFEEFDHAAFHALHVRPAGQGLMRVELYLEGVRCASCVWLVERLPLAVPGAARVELNIRRSLATVEWDPSIVALSRIARTLDSLGYTPHPFRGVRRDEVRRREDRAALARIGVAGAVAANVMLASLALYSGWWSGMEASFARYFRWVSLVLTAVAVVGPGRVFFTSAWAALRTRTLHMDLPIAIALGAGFARGAVNTFADAGPIYLDGVAMLVFLLLCGRYLQQRGQRATSDAAELLYSLTPATARLVTGDGVRDVPAAAVVPGHVLEVRSGESLAADGVVESGASTVNVALLTGESKPVGVGPGDLVYAGTLNVASLLRVRVTRAGEESRVARLVRQVEDSARNRAPVVLLADRLAGRFTGAVLVLAGLVFAFWLRRDPDRAMDNAIALLVVTCPCALALATPLAVSAAIGRAARAGIFVKGGQALEVLARPGTIFLDKTGTLTRGETSLVTWEGEDWVKPLVLALEQESTHPIAVAVRSAFADTPILSPTWSHHVVGHGIEGMVAGRQVMVGSPRFVDRHPEDRSDEGPSRGPRTDVGMLTPVWVSVDGHLVARAGFGDPVRADTRQALDALRGRGWRLAILSGDDRRVAQSVGAALGFAPDECHGELSPERKCDAVQRERARTNVVMVGDGVNDAAAIAAASVGIGVHGGAEASLATADVYLTHPGLSSLVQLTDGARRTMAIIRRGIAFSLGYNVIGATLAMTGVINPLIAAVLMPASSLTVLLAAWRGRSFDRGGELA